MNVAAWAAPLEMDQQFLSAITVFEVELGIRQVERRDPVQAAVLWRWFDRAVLDAFDGRILPVDRDVARLAARLHVPDPYPERDAFIAATALARGLTVATRNVTVPSPTPSTTNFAITTLPKNQSREVYRPVAWASPRRGMGSRPCRPAGRGGGGNSTHPKISPLSGNPSPPPIR